MNLLEFGVISWSEMIFWMFFLYDEFSLNMSLTC